METEWISVWGDVSNILTTADKFQLLTEKVEELQKAAQEATVTLKDLKRRQKQWPKRGPAN